MMIHMSSPEGNAFVIMGYVRSYLKQTGASNEEIDAAMVEMKRGDYKHLCETATRVTNGYLEIVNDMDDEYDVA